VAFRLSQRPGVEGSQEGSYQTDMTPLGAFANVALFASSEFIAIQRANIIPYMLKSYNASALTRISRRILLMNRSAQAERGNSHVI